MPEHMQEYSDTIFSNLSRGDLIQIVTICLVICYLMYNFTKKK